MTSKPSQIAVSAQDAAATLAISERKFHDLRNDPEFPKPRLIGNRLRWLLAELESWLVRQPAIGSLPEPPQLRGTQKRQSLAPKPEAWPASSGA